MVYGFYIYIKLVEYREGYFFFGEVGIENDSDVFIVVFDDIGLDGVELFRFRRLR